MASAMSRLAIGDFWILCLAVFLLQCLNGSYAETVHRLLTLRGGLVPQASDKGGEYYEKFELDYGCDDKIRNAGALRGFIKSGSLINLPQSDPFLKWLQEHLEKGNMATSGRIKPFYVSTLNIYLLLGTTCMV
jgi:hypothetical protein